VSKFAVCPRGQTTRTANPRGAGDGGPRDLLALAGDRPGGSDSRLRWDIGCLAHHYMARLFKAALLWPLDDSQTDSERERLDQSLEAGATARSLAGLGSSTAEGLEERHSEDFDPGLMSSPRERGVPGHEWRGERLRERNVDRVVGREIMTQRPDPVHEQMMRIAL
jgi:hypothetical protein